MINTKEHLTDRQLCAEYDLPYRNESLKIIDNLDSVVAPTGLPLTFLQKKQVLATAFEFLKKERVYFSDPVKADELMNPDTNQVWFTQEFLQKMVYRLRDSEKETVYS